MYKIHSVMVRAVNTLAATWSQELCALTLCTELLRIYLLFSSPLYLSDVSSPHAIVREQVLQF